MKKNRIAIIGTGTVGSTIAFDAAMSGMISEILLIDMKTEKTEAEARDLTDAMMFQHHTCLIHAGSYAECSNMDIIIITAAAPLIQGQTRLDMLNTAKTIVSSIVPPIMKSGFSGHFIVITNPVDIISYYVYKLSGLPPERVIGTGNALDSARLKVMLSNIYNVNWSSIQAYTIGEHGDSQFIPWSTVAIAGKAINDIISDNPKLSAMLDKERILADVKDEGWKIARIKNTTNFGIAGTTMRIAKAILDNESAVIPVSTYLNGEYGFSDIYISVPAVIDQSGVSDILNLHLTTDEKTQLARSASVIKEYIASL